MTCTETAGRQVKKGFRTVGAWLLGFAWLCLVFAGIIIGFSQNKYPRGLGWALLAVAAAVLVLTADRWIKAFPGILGVATFNSLIAVFSGHATGNVSVLIPKTTAILATLLLAVGTVLSLSFRNERMSALDRSAVLTLVVSIGWGAVDIRRWLHALAVGICCLFLAVLYKRSKPPRLRSR
jgi:hypothetical protein